MIALGIFKVLLSVILGLFFVDLIAIFPKSILGIMLIYAGLYLADVGLKKHHDFLTIGTGACCAGLNTWFFLLFFLNNKFKVFFFFFFDLGKERC